MLTDRIRLIGPESNEPEDVLASALGVIFPDDITNQHGDKDSGVAFLSRRFGDVELSLADPEGETSRRLFSHFLWNSSLQLAEFIEDADNDDQSSTTADAATAPATTRSPLPSSWSVRGQTVLELGAGTGLAGIISALCGARRTVITDYPAPEVLANIAANVSRNIAARNTAAAEQAAAAGLPPPAPVEVEIVGHEWGVTGAEQGKAIEKDGDEKETGDAAHTPPPVLPPSPDPSIFAAAHAGAFSRILVADCLWMPWQHGALQRSIAHFLARRGGRAWVIAGFHTGRAKMRGFFDAAALRAAGLVAERVWERNAEGVERPWAEDRGVEDPTARKRWLVIGILKHVEDEVVNEEAT